jgi:predicted TIM-barrel fold metal-dependent hydrolase
MQNVHTHVWDANLHHTPPDPKNSHTQTLAPAESAIRYEDFIRDMAPFEHVIVFGQKARRAGWWVPDEYVAEFVSTAPDQLIGFASCDPTQPGYLAEFMYAVETLHLRGVKLSPVSAGFDPASPICEPVYHYCQKYGLPVIIQSGMNRYDPASEISFGRPWLLDEIAVGYPELKIVLTHAGNPFMDECLAVLAKNPNVYADFSGLQSYPWQFYQFLISAQEYQVMNKLLFGSNYPFVRSDDAINGLKNAGQVAARSGFPQIADEKIQAIFQRDACALLGLYA